MRHRRRYGKSNKEYGRERAKRHIEEARAFSAEVGHADQAVKEAFFSLSAKALDHLLNEYGRLYGETPEQYARDTISKWRSGVVKMSGTVSKRLFALLPPYMPAEQKNKMVEAIWKRYGPRSVKYIYMGPDSDHETVVTRLETYFGNINVLYPIPEHLKECFDWLSDNDVVAKERLMNYFMDQQRHVAIAKARLYIPMLLASMNADEGGRITKLSHSVFVGNHHVEIRADPRRSGFILSDSQTDAVRAPWTLKVPVSLWIVAAIIASFFVYNWLHHG
jgi:hypothetical protein